MRRSNKLKKELQPQVLKDRKVKRELVKSATTLFLEEKKRMLATFDSHPVTREIRGGANGANLSGTMQGGNLFGFIGFTAGSDPISPLREVLEAINIRPKFERASTGEKIFIVDIPDVKIMYAATPMPWASGRSWLEGVERGMSGLGRYLNTKSIHSRSGGGIQSDHTVKGGAFSGVTYLTNGGILQEFQERLMKLSSGGRTIITN